MFAQDVLKPAHLVRFGVLARRVVTAQGGKMCAPPDGIAGVMRHRDIQLEQAERITELLKQNEELKAKLKAHLYAPGAQWGKKVKEMKMLCRIMLEKKKNLSWWSWSFGPPPTVDGIDEARCKALDKIEDEGEL